MSVDAFGHDRTLARGRCNLCWLEGKVFEFDAEDPGWLKLVEIHTALAHPGHNEMLKAGIPYEPGRIDAWT